MNIEFHYYILYIISRKAGFSENEAYILAYSSQYVDTNVAPVIIAHESGTFQAMVTHNYSFWNTKFPKEIYMPFHFFPGGSTKPSQMEGEKQKPVVCQPGAKPVRTLLEKALRTGNLYRIGIALHTYSDSFAHQNFTGFIEPWNELSPDSPIPALGHAQAGTKPDKLDLQWVDTRLDKKYRKINNRRRFISAVHMIYKFLSTFNGRNFNDADLIIEELQDLIGRPGEEPAMEERILNYIVEEDIPQFNESEWLADAAYTSTDPYADYMPKSNAAQWLKDTVLHEWSNMPRKRLKAKENFYKSHFYKWHTAAEQHKAEAKNILSHYNLL